jgi:hypothetical protein
MKKTITLLLLIVCNTLVATAQNSTIAKLKYESAEENFSAGNYSASLEKLKEAEKLFGKSNPPISHLKIMVLDKLVEKDTDDTKENRKFENIALLAEECNWYMKNYSTLKETEDKTREVFKLQEKYLEKYKNINEIVISVNGAKKGSEIEAYNLGEIYEKDKLKIRAISWYLTAANKENIPAMLKAFYLIYITSGGNNDEVQKNISRYLIKAVENGNTDAMLEYGDFLTWGEYGIIKDEATALKMYVKAFDKGNKIAAHRLGWIYYKGFNGVTIDYHKALVYFTTAIENNYYFSYYGLAQMYSEGNGVPQDHKKALESYNKIIQHHPDAGDAYVQIGHLYKNGNGVEKNYKKAVEFYQTATKKEAMWDEVSSKYLGLLYYEGGYGLTQDYNKAFDYFSKSPFNTSMFYLGQMYELGKGVTQNYSTALGWYKQAADKNYTEAMLSLGRMYENGLGTKKDKKMAQFWYQKAEQAKLTETK